jgi:hypothetical protein
MNMIPLHLQRRYEQRWAARLTSTRNEKVFRLAVELAESGKYRNWKDIQEKLVERDYRRAPDLLDSKRIRAILDTQCDRGRDHQR